MKIKGVHYRSVWVAEDCHTVEVLDQTRLPFEVKILQLHTLEDAATAIKEMWVRGAPLIGVVAAYGVALAMRESANQENLQRAYTTLIETRPTAINLKWSLDRIYNQLKDIPVVQRQKVAYRIAGEIAEEDVQLCKNIGQHGLMLIRQIAASKPKNATINILTHCNAGWLATVDWGTALSPIYMAHDAGINVHVWVDETRPRNQGGLTAFELGAHGVPHTIIADNTGGHLMQHGLVDLCIVGTDRTTARGDVCNKIGTYLKALAAKANNVPFYVALPSPTIDFTVSDGIKEIPIEQRSGEELSWIYGIDAQGKRNRVNIVPVGSCCANYAFDVTPAELISGFITERGICKADEKSIASLFNKSV